MARYKVHDLKSLNLAPIFRRQKIKFVAVAMLVFESMYLPYETLIQIKYVLYMSGVEAKGKTL